MHDTRVIDRRNILTEWNRSRVGDHQLDSVADALLADHEITDRDRVAFALRELRRLGYETDADPVDWTKERMICSVDLGPFVAFGNPTPSDPYQRLRRIASRSHVRDRDDVEQTVTDVAAELYGEESEDRFTFLERPYNFTFNGDAALVESVFQAVGFSTRVGLMVPDDDSETYYSIEIATPMIVLERGLQLG